MKTDALDIQYPLSTAWILRALGTKTLFKLVKVISSANPKRPTPISFIVKMRDSQVFTSLGTERL